MLSCEETKNLLSAYYDGELGIAAANEVAQHLASCEECKKIYDDMSFLSGAFAGIAYPEIDEKFKRSLQTKLFDVSKSMRPKGFGAWSSKMRPYIAAAACFVLVVGVYALVYNGQTLTNTSQLEPMLLQLQPDETTKDIEIQTEEVSPTPKSDMQKHGVEANQNTKHTYDLKTTKPVNDVVTTQENTANAQAEFSVLDDAGENALVNSRSVVEDIVEDKTNQLDQSEMITPLPSQAPLDKETDLIDESAQAHGGGGAASTQIKPAMAQFVLLDKTHLDALKDIVYNYGTCDIDENYIHLTLLSANYDACIELISGLDWIEVSEIGENSGGEYCYIQINIR